MLNNYTISDFFKNFYYLIITKIYFPKARLIRRPIFIRGKQKLKIEKGFTTGRECRFDLNNGRNLKDKTLVFGKNCKLGDRVHIVASKNVIFGDDCLLASNIFISDTSHGSYKGEFQSSPSVAPDNRKLFFDTVKIGNRVWIGENVCILPGVTVGDGVIIGANSILTRSVEENSMVVGSPAKVIKKYNHQKNKWEIV